ncbi:hypothetical protein LTR16_011827, partial [Cryomyces antarcticus]
HHGPRARCKPGAWRFRRLRREMLRVWLGRPRRVLGRCYARRKRQAAESDPLRVRIGRAADLARRRCWRADSVDDEGRRKRSGREARAGDGLRRWGSSSGCDFCAKGHTNDHLRASSSGV